MLFSLPFLGAGVLIMLVAGRVIPVKASSVHVPMWVLGAVGAVFFLAGVWVFVAALGAVRQKARMEAQRRQDPGQYWMGDSLWDPNQARSQGGRKVASVFAIGLFLALFAVPFNHVHAPLCSGGL